MLGRSTQPAWVLEDSRAQGVLQDGMRRGDARE